MAKLVVLLRVKDGIFFVKDWLDCYERLADEIVVLDNNSTDGTYELLKAHPKVVEIEQTFDYHEGRDKNMMYALARRRNPDWCLWVDIDELFEPQLTRKHFDKLMSRSWVNKYAFRRFHFIDREHFAGSWYRLNYSSGHDRIMWRESPVGYFENLIIDSPNVKGITGITLYTNYRLKHTGYISKEIVDKKAGIYRAIVPEKEDTFQKMYMRNERPIKWIDNRNDIRVIALNGLLSGLQFINLFRKAYRKVQKMVSNAFSSTQPNDVKATV